MNLDPAHCEWRKSTASSDNNACVEISRHTAVGVRDTKNRTSGHLAPTPNIWDTFITAVKHHRA